MTEQRILSRAQREAWLPPGGMTGRFERFDARPGGSYRMVLRCASPSASRGKATPDADIVEARFMELVPCVRVVQSGQCP